MSIQQRIQVFANSDVKNVSSHEKLFEQHGFQRIGTRIVSKPGKKLKSITHIFKPTTNNPNIAKLGTMLNAKGYKTAGSSRWKKGGNLVSWKYGELTHNHRIGRDKLYD